MPCLVCGEDTSGRSGGEVDTRFIDVLVDIPAVGDRRFTYRAPEGACLPVGAKVRVPFGRGEADGFIAGAAAPPERFEAKPLKAVYDPEFMPGEALRELATEVSRYYCAPVSSAWSCLWPPVALKRKPDAAGNETEGSAQARSGALGAETGSCSKDRESRAVLLWGGKDFRWKKYISDLREVRAAGRGAIVLVPEVKAIEDAASYLEREFPGDVAKLHSEQTGVARRAAYLSLIRGEKRIALGTRSAVFAPVAGLGAIVIEDEPAEAYKSPDLPFYDSRTVGRMRSRSERCALILGSSHPSVEAYWDASQGRIDLREEASGDGGVELFRYAPTSVVDLRPLRRGRDVLSQSLAGRLRTTFASGEKAILFLNRRGESSQVTCQDCGNVLACPRCGVPLGYHSKEAALVCHTCGHRELPPEVCPSCGGHRWKFGGIGIERAEAEVRRLFPEIEVYRMDQDVTKDRPAAGELAAFASSPGPSCLLATRMLLGFPEVPPVSTVGVLSCDTLLNLPDFRASEKVFHLLWSLRELAAPGGAFVVQSYNPEHSGVTGISDAAGFYRGEVEARRLLGYPPHRQLVKVRFSGRNLAKVQESADRFAKAAVEGGSGVSVLGPVPSPKPKVRGEHRWQAALRGEDRRLMAGLCARAASAAEVSGVRVSVDVDPVDMA